MTALKIVATGVVSALAIVLFYWPLHWATAFLNPQGFWQRALFLFVLIFGGIGWGAIIFIVWALCMVTVMEGFDGIRRTRSFERRS